MIPSSCYVVCVQVTNILSVVALKEKSNLQREREQSQESVKRAPRITRNRKFSRLECHHIIVHYIITSTDTFTPVTVNKYVANVEQDMFDSTGACCSLDGPFFR
jgi:hypothetical protein